MTELIAEGATPRLDKGPIARLGRPRIFALESDEEYDALRATHFAELAPRTPYEQALAEALVGYEWEIARMARFRDGAMLAKYREYALNLLVSGDPKRRGLDTQLADEHYALAAELVGLEASQRSAAEDRFFDLTGFEPADLQALAYANASEVTTYNARIADLERRRRLLREDYSRLTACRSKAEIEDAIVVEAQNGD